MCGNAFRWADNVTEEETRAAIEQNDRELKSADRICFWFFGIVNLGIALIAIALLTLFVKRVWYY
jgi:hypothetical protein